MFPWWACTNVQLDLGERQSTPGTLYLRRSDDRRRTRAVVGVHRATYPLQDHRTHTAVQLPQPCCATLLFFTLVSQNGIMREQISVQTRQAFILEVLIRGILRQWVIAEKLDEGTQEYPGPGATP